MNTMTVSPLQPKFATKRDFDDFQDTVANEFKRVQGRLDEVELNLGNKIDGLGSRFEGLGARIDGLGEEVNNLRADMKEFKGEIIKAIKNN